MTGARKLNALTSIRFIAAAMIVMHHLRGLFGVSEHIGDPFILDQSVAFFFVLSGFVLTYVYPSLEAGGARRFLQARVARVWPAHIVALALLFLLLPAPARTVDGGYSVGHLAANLAMVQAWIPWPSYYFGYNAVAWSISTEFGFYLCFPLLIRNWRETWAPKLFVTLLFAAGMIWLGNARPEMEVGLTYVNPLARLFEFTLGMTAALCWQTVGTRFSLRPLAGTLIEVTAIGIAVVCMYFTGPWAVWAGQWIGHAGTMWLLHGGAPSLAFAVLIMVMAWQRGLISRALSLSLPVLLGEISYSVYLIHQILVRYYGQHARAFSQAPHWPPFILFWVLVLLMAHLIYLLFERPMRAFLVRPSLPFRDVWSRAQRTLVQKMPEVHNAARGHRLWLAGEGATLAAAIVLVGYFIHLRPTVVFVDETYASQVRRQTPAEVRDVKFGTRLVLVGASISRAPQDVSLELTWQSMHRQQLRSNVLLHVVDSDGKILGQADYQQDPAHSEVPAGKFWADQIRLPLEAVQHASAVAIGFYGTNAEDLVADRGPRDWGGRRLLLPLTAAARDLSDVSSSSESAIAYEAGVLPPERAQGSSTPVVLMR